jgi:Sulfatase
MKGANLASGFRVLTAPVLPSFLFRMLPWLKLVGALLAFVVISLYTAIDSELGRPLTTGESPAFSVAKSYAGSLLLFGLCYLLLVSGLQVLGSHGLRLRYTPSLQILAGLELLAVGILAVAFLLRWDGALPLGHTLLQGSLISQVLLTTSLPSQSRPISSVELFDINVQAPFLFLSFVFLLAAVPASLNPLQRPIEDYVQLDSSLEVLLIHILPPLFSGIIGLWFGIATLALLVGGRKVWLRVKASFREASLLQFMPFLLVSGLYTGIFLASLIFVIDWELERLNLKGAVAPLFILLTGSLGALSALLYRRMAFRWRLPDGDMIGMLALAMAALLTFPILWLPTRLSASRRPAWFFIICLSFFATVVFAYYIIYGDLFNPWFTVFSYLKGALLKSTAVLGAGILTLAATELFSSRSRKPLRSKSWIGLVALSLAGLFPFYFVDRFPKAKAAIFYYNELSMVDATYARAVSGFLGLGRWIRLGQTPKSDNHQPPWPRPWTLEKAGPSLLPKDFNLIVIIVDALRGDAFRSAGYHRDLTPFLDAWGKNEAVLFRRAYSQGGGTFAGYPFLVAGRSHFTYYGADLYRDNLYFHLAQAEGINRIMIVQDWPRAIFPPDFPLIRLGITQQNQNQRSVSAGEVFGWAQEAIEKSKAEGQRFFAFLHLLDVHNDLWKKEEGIDFGDSPRDLYDNNLSYLDKVFARFVAWLKQKGVYDQTVILFTSDHGEQFWEHGASLHGHSVFEEDIRIPLILRVPEITPGIREVPATAADMVPTIADLAGYAVQPPYDDSHMGISLLALLLGKERDRYLIRDIVGMASFKRRYFLYRNWQWKLIYSADFDLIQLYNTSEDPQERRNLLQEKRELGADMERELLGYLKKVEGKSYRPLLSAAP